MTSRKAILTNAFHPGTELDDPALFAGRSAQVLELTQALHAEGSCPIIYGDRGLGKSSLALQVQRIAMGDPSLLELQRTSPTTRFQEDTPPIESDDATLGEWAFGEEGSYLAFYVACSDATSTTESVLQRLINSLMSVDTGSATSASQLIDRTTRKRITLKLFEAEVTRKYQLPPPTPSYTELSTEEKLLGAVQRVVNAYGHPVLLIIDELDRVRDTSGLASFIKNASSIDLKFLLVGIAQNISSLLSDHRSLERIAVPVRVSGMTREELTQIVDRATEKLEQYGIRFQFDSEAADALASAAAGFPWFVHLLGQSALLTADEDHQEVVRHLHVVDAVRSLMTNRLAQQFSDLYQTAVRDSPKREHVLRALALWDGRDIPTAEVFRVLRRLSITKPSPYVSQLCSETYGRVLVKSPSQGIVRFANEMFKVYTRIRPSLYEHVDSVVRQASQRQYVRYAPRGRPPERTPG
jgi:Cdc6-like AAA superfamily ATPase